MPTVKDAKVAYTIKKTIELVHKKYGISDVEDGVASLPNIIDEMNTEVQDLAFWEFMH